MTIFKNRLSNQNCFKSITKKKFKNRVTAELIKHEIDKWGTKIVSVNKKSQRLTDGECVCGCGCLRE